MEFKILVVSFTLGPFPKFIKRFSYATVETHDISRENHPKTSKIWRGDQSWAGEQESDKAPNGATKIGFLLGAIVR